MNNYFTFSEIAQTLNISESTLRRKLKNLPEVTLKKLIKHEKGKVYLNDYVLSTFSTSSTIDRPENISNHGNNTSEKKEITNSEIQYLRKQNDLFLNKISDKDLQIKNLTSLIVKLQNDINTYIKLLPENSKETTNVMDTIIKVVLILSIIILTFYLIFG